MTQQPTVLVVGDESSILDTLRILLRKDGYEVTIAQGGKAGLEQIRSGNQSIVLTDVRMPQVTGLDILKAAKEQDPETPVILMTAQAELRTAIEALNQGAFHYIGADRLCAPGRQPAQVHFPRSLLSWSAQSGVRRDCKNCHSTEDPGGTSNTSFCSNSACHGSVWEYAGFDAPKLREILLSQMPPQPTPQPLPTGGALTYTDTIGPLRTARCGNCHSSGGMQGLDLTSYASAMKGGSSGAPIIASDAENSLLVQKQSGEQAHFGQLSPDELQTVIDWIAAGAPE